MWVYLNGRFVPEERAVISVFDHGFLYGDGVFETLRAYKGVVFALPLHLQRLHRSAKGIGLRLPKIPFEALLNRALKRNGLSEALVRITVSRGPGPLTPSRRACQSPTVVIFSRPFKPRPQRLYRDGFSAVIARTRRNTRSSLDPRIKSANFLNSILAQGEAEASGADEAILLGPEGFLAEGSISNLFFVKDSVLHTPESKTGILEGITRQVVLTLAGDAGIRTVEGRFRPEKLYRASEAFLTNTSWEIAPLTAVGARKIGDGKPGKTTQSLIGLFRKRVYEEVKAGLKRKRTKEA